MPPIQLFREIRADDEIDGVTVGQEFAHRVNGVARTVTSNLAIGHFDQREVTEGRARAVVRLIQDARKRAGFDVSDRISVRYFASDGRFELFKMTTKYDGKVGRQQHRFPTEQELPL